MQDIIILDEVLCGIAEKFNQEVNKFIVNKQEIS